MYNSENKISEEWELNLESKFNEVNQVKGFLLHNVFVLFDRSIDLCQRAVQGCVSFCNLANKTSRC